ncbi:replication initiator protein A [Leuconostoc falkenbergense]|uniref:replication initiator protein A n=1 Tax=Leuconostoc falkenbergense TaxID=2766470 RepID=UPI0021A262DE|nr:replication initiator protein A [Leuconostoc falkenbergense]MCT4388985.1 plasmid replication initiation protein [Leuconostoc falkenbergense]
MTQFNFIQSQNAYGTKFFQLPQVLLYGEKYKKLSDSAKLGYVVLRDRLEYSLQNNWIDDENRVYFIFTNQELEKIFGWSKRKVATVKKELEQAGLLFQIQQGFDPKKKQNLPNRLYLADLEVTAKDVYIKHDFANKTAETLATSGSAEMRHRQENNKTAETLATSGSAEMRHRQETVETLATSGSAEMRHNLYKTNLDTNKDTNKDTSMLDFSSTNFSQDVLQKQNQDIVANASEFLVSNGNSGKIPLEAETIKLISLWSANDPKKMEKMIGIIFNAKKASETFITQQTGTPTTIFLDNYEDLQHDITVSLRRTFNAIRNKQDKKQKVNPENYIFGAMRNTFEVWYSEYMQSLSSNG